MSALDNANKIRSAAASLLEEIKAEFNVMTVAESHEAYSILRETEGYLLGCRRFLEPEGMPLADKL
jgi:hypothetical protein